MIHTGAIVYLSRRDHHDAIRCTVALASEDGRSLLLSFEAIIDFPGGLYVGNMPVYRRDDGRWVEIVGGHEVRIEESN